MTGVADQLVESRQAISSVFRSPSLRRLNYRPRGFGDRRLGLQRRVLGLRVPARRCHRARRDQRGAVRHDGGARLDRLRAGRQLDRRRLMIAADVVRAVLVLATQRSWRADGPAIPVYVLSVLVGIVGLIVPTGTGGAARPASHGIRRSSRLRTLHRARSTASGSSSARWSPGCSSRSPTSGGLRVRRADVRLVGGDGVRRTAHHRCHRDDRRRRDADRGRRACRRRSRRR